jgi:bacterioferritin-associated ferredoxin
MANRPYDHMIAGISSYPDLEKRLAAELTYSKPSGSGCGQCQKQKIIRKFKSLLDLRRKKEPPSRRY